TKDLSEATDKANRARVALMDTRGGPDGSGPAIIAAHDTTYAAVTAEIAHLSEFATPPAARMTELRALQSTIQRSKTAEVTRHLRGESDRAAALPDTDMPAKRDAIIRTNSAELAHLQQVPGADAGRMGALEKAITDTRRARAVAAPIPIT
ncbi:MAG TPA: hypothetical protein PKV72_05550, partial [Candidatus Peribacteria bacterium]|nr:hypothetical protein [Candidatus Peribacteria bacterium]